MLYIIEVTMISYFLLFLWNDVVKQNNVVMYIETNK